MSATWAARLREGLCPGRMCEPGGQAMSNVLIARLSLQIEAYYLEVLFPSQAR